MEHVDVSLITCSIARVLYICIYDYFYYQEMLFFVEIHREIWWERCIFKELNQDINAEKITKPIILLKIDQTF